MDNLIDVVEDLSLAFGVSGFEDPVRERIKDRLNDLNTCFETDVMGNLTVTLDQGRDFTVMVDAHMDEVGLMVNCVEEEGWLRFATLGGWDPRILPAHQVSLLSHQGNVVTGVIGAAPPHVQSPEDQQKPIQLDSLFIDIGSRSKNETEKLGITVGTPGVLALPFRRLAGGMFTGKALDDRVGCALLIQLLRHYHAHPPGYTLVANFAVHEETGLRGAKTATHRIRPDLAFVVETTTGDTPGTPAHQQPTRIGCGPAITLADKNILVRPALVKAVTETALQSGIPFQTKRPLTGGTDAGAIHLSRGGVLTSVLSVPCRYLHSPVGMAYEQDVYHTFSLLRALLDRAPSIYGQCAP
ncbi:MAG: M42 family peptidase [Deltaproteobacteria bacterium]|nr:M42 family peptidase [Deltaproteobacteria bacterium]